MSIFLINRGGYKTSPLSFLICARPVLSGVPHRTGRFLAGLFFCALFSGALAVAPVASHAEDSSAVSSPTTKIVTDNDKGTVTIVIDGKPVLQVDKDGLHVVGNIVYGGTLTDTGSAHVEKTIAGAEDAR
jgi:hypothetical protein